MRKRFLYLDTFATVRTAADVALAAAIRDHIASEGFVLVVGTQNLREFVSWPKRWAEVTSFVSSVPFCVAQNPEEIIAQEVASYPNELASLPLLFSSSDYSSSDGEMADLLFRLKEGLAKADRRFRAHVKEVFEAVLAKRQQFLPEKEGKYSSTERQMFMQSSVFAMLFPEHRDFLSRALAAARADGQEEGVRIERFKSIYIQALAIFTEFYVQKKPGKLSDMGDILQLSLAPYVDLSVLDNERTNLVHRFNRERLLPVHLQACSFSDFKAEVNNSSLPS